MSRCNDVLQRVLRWSRVSVNIASAHRKRHRRLASPTSTYETHNAPTPGSNPVGILEHHDWGPDNDTHTTTIDSHNNVDHEGNSPSLFKLNHPIEGAPASLHNSQDTSSVTSISEAVELIQRVTTPAEAHAAVLATNSWLSSLPQPHRREATHTIRSKAMEQFLIVWTPPGDNHLNVGEHGAPVMNNPQTNLDSTQQQHLVNTIRGDAVAILVGKLVQIDVLSTADAAHASELLFEHRRKDGYARALYTVLDSMGEKVFRLPVSQRMLTIAKGMRGAKEETSTPEMLYYADPIIRMIRRCAEHKPRTERPPSGRAGEARGERMD